MKTANRILLSILVVVCAACKQQPYPEVEVSTPVFTMSGTMDGESLEIAAGIDGYYMDAVLTQNSFNVYEYLCTFNKPQCATCNESLSILLHDTDECEGGANPFADDLLSAQTLPFAAQSNSSQFLTIEFETSPGPDMNYAWDFDDGATAADINEVTHTFPFEGPFNVNLIATDNGGPPCEVSITQTIYAGQPMLCAKKFMYNFENDEIHLDAPFDLPPYLQWEHWEVNGTQYNQPHVEVDINQDEDLDISLFFLNTELNITGEYTLHMEENSPPCNEDFHHHWLAEEINLAAAEITYTKADGTTYSSVTTLNATTDSYFQILTAEDYEGGLNGKTAKKITALLNCSLVNVNDAGDVIMMEEVNATLGFITQP